MRALANVYTDRQFGSNQHGLQKHYSEQTHQHQHTVYGGR